MIVKAVVRFVNRFCRLGEILAGIEFSVIDSKVVGDNVVHAVKLAGEKEEVRSRIKALRSSGDFRLLDTTRSGSSGLLIACTTRCPLHRILYQGSLGVFLARYTVGEDGVAEAVLIGPRRDVEKLIGKLRPYAEIKSVKMDKLSLGVDLTEKQRTILRRAIELGYYAIPRKVGLIELSKELGIPKSTLAEALRRIEAKAVRLLLELYETG